MKMSFISVYRLNEQEKKCLTDNIPPTRQEFDRLYGQYKQLCDRVDKQEAVIRELTMRIDELSGITGSYRGSAVSRALIEKLYEIPEGYDYVDIPDETELSDRSSLAPLVEGVKEVREIDDSWEEILASINNGSYRRKYSIGNFKPLDLGSEGMVEMQIAGFDAEELSDGSGWAAITWISRSVLKEKHRMNPLYKEGKTGTGGLGGWKNSKMREYLNTEILSLLSPVIQKI